MKFVATPLDGAWVIEQERLADERGFFARAWAADALAAYGCDATVAQINMSGTYAAGTFRGFHWQDRPLGEAKTTRCVQGSVFNCIIDMRPESETFKQWFGVELSEQNGTMLHVPEQFANGFLILEDNTTILYTVSREYQAGNERGIRHDDPEIGVVWPIPVATVSAKDAAWPDVSSFPL